MDIKPLIITADSTVIQAMRQLSETACRILLLCEKERFLGIVTDGDIRRFILRGGELSQSCEQSANLSAHTVLPGEFDRAKTIMRTVDTDAVPVVDKEGKLCDLYYEGQMQCSKKASVDLPVVIMAGGLGTRLYPYTKILPKPLIPIGDIPIIEHIIKRFAAAGCTKFFIVVNHRKNMIKSYFAEQITGYDVTFIDEDKPLGTAGGLSLLKQYIDTPFFLTNCDILVEADYSDVFSEHKEQGNAITVVTAFKHIVIPYGVLKLDDSGALSEFAEKPQIDVLTNTGFYLIEPQVLADIEDDTPISMPEIIDNLKANQARVGAYPVREDAFMDMGQLEELEDMRRRLQHGSPQ